MSVIFSILNILIKSFVCIPMIYLPAKFHYDCFNGSLFWVFKLKFINLYSEWQCVLFKLAPLHEGLLGSRGIAPRILDLGTRWIWVVSFTSRPLYPQGKSPRYPLDRRLGGPPEPFWTRGGEEKNSLPRRESNPRTPIVQPVA